MIPQIRLDGPAHQCRIGPSNRIEIHSGIVTHLARYCECGTQVDNSRPVADQQVQDSDWINYTVRGTWLRLTAVNGSVSWCWSCRDCKFGQAVKHALVPPEIVNGDPGYDYQIKENVGMAPPCERCGSTAGTEYHHYAPRHLFPDADMWATGYLCRPCHTEWHRKTRTGAFSQQRTA